QNPVLETSYAVLPHSADVRVSHEGISTFAASLVETLGELPSSSSWANELLHPIPALHLPQEQVDWIFLVSGLLNFSFWSEFESVELGRFALAWRDGVDGKGDGKQVNHAGYWSLPAAINRALEVGIPATSPTFWIEATDEQWKSIFRACKDSKESIPLLHERIRLLRQTGQILIDEWGGSFFNFLQSLGPRYDALEIVQKVVQTFPAFRDENIHPQVGRVYLWKRAQILAAELWAAFSSCPERYMQITNISALTMFADYRVPQILQYLGLLVYSPRLLNILSSMTSLGSGSELELSIRCGSIVAVEEVRLAVCSILSNQGRGKEAARVNAVLLDFWLWGRAKELEKEGKTRTQCHRTRSIWY
ncbi:MAG: hypothetical protein CYPHOPRED_003776, partial [Cyphobasidiales sp. Tagirdzhanova-0007]